MRRKQGLRRTGGFKSVRGLKSPPRGLKSKSGLKRSSAPKRKVKVRPLNVARARKRQAAYQAYLRGPVWKEKKRLVRERSGGWCEYRGPDRWDPKVLIVERCEIPATSTHHLRYPRKLGTEPIEWLLDVCDTHHLILEDQHPWRAARRQALARSKP